MDFDALWQGYQGERQRAAAALDYLQQQGWIELESKQMTEVYRVVRQDLAIESLADQLHALFEQKEQSELARLQALLGFFTSSRCLSHELARYFADEEAPERCGHCSVCRGDSRAAAVAASGLAQRAWLARLVRSSDCPVSPASSPDPDPLPVWYRHPLTTRTKARNLAGFGQLAAHPFAEVLAVVSAIYPADS